MISIILDICLLLFAAGLGWLGGYINGRTEAAEEYLAGLRAKRELEQLVRGSRR